MSDLLPLRTDPVGGQRARRPWRRAGVVIVLLLLAALVGGVLVGGRAVLSSFDDLTNTVDPDYSGPGSGAVTVRVQDGDTAADIAKTLQGQDVVQSTGAFSKAAAAEPASLKIQPGFYRLRSRMSAEGAVAQLIDPRARLLSRVTLPEGETVPQTLARVTKSIRTPDAQLRAALRQSAALGLPAYAKGRPEGFLFPATYDIEPGTNAAGTLKQMVDRYQQAASKLRLEERAKALGRTPYEVVTAASLIEEETAFAGDRAKVARVVYNRLDAKQPLQFDSTINYFLPQKKGRLLEADTRIENPYNTYLNAGLPPTPIGSPGEAALEAALNPAPGNWLYFITISKDGRSLFTADYDEFVNAKKKSQAEGIY